MTAKTIVIKIEREAPSGFVTDILIHITYWTSDFDLSFPCVMGSLPIERCLLMTGVN